MSKKSGNRVFGRKPAIIVALVTMVSASHLWWLGNNDVLMGGILVVAGLYIIAALYLLISIFFVSGMKYRLVVGLAALICVFVVTSDLLFYAFHETAKYW